MLRSHRWILLIIFMIVIGITITVGIVYYNSIISVDLIKFTPNFQVKQKSDDRNLIFPVDNAQIKKITVLNGGKVSLDISKKEDEILDTWVLNGNNLLSIDKKKLDRYIEDLLQMRFSAKISSGNFTLKDLGLDYPKYEVRLAFNDGSNYSFSVGGMIPGTKTSYAIQNNEIKTLGTLNEQVNLLQKGNSYFFIENILDFKTEEIEAMRFQNVSRNLNLKFAKIDDNWQLVEPYRTPANNGEFTAILNNLVNLTTKFYIDYTFADYLNLKSNFPVFSFTLEEKTRKANLNVFEDKLGNFYGRIDNQGWLFMLPNSFKLITEKPVNFLLEYLIKLPEFSKIKLIQFDSIDEKAEYERQDEETWLYNDSEEILQSGLEIWYNSLVNNTIISTETFRPNTNSDMRIKIVEMDGNITELAFENLANNFATLIVNDDSTGLVVKVPDLPLKP